MFTYSCLEGKKEKGMEGRSSGERSYMKTKIQYKKGRKMMKEESKRK